MAAADWFKGKAKERLIGLVLPALKTADELGYWPKGVSRWAKAALNKQSVAEKFAKENEERLKGICEDPARPWAHTIASDILLAMRYGMFARAPEVGRISATLRVKAQPGAEYEALDVVDRWAEDFTPIAKLVQLLDSRRPKPTIVMKTLSPTVVNNVGRAMGIWLKSIFVPDMEGRWVKQPDGREAYVVKILWPEGTRHNMSRFAFAGKSGNAQCHACGHAIKNPWNWVPLVGDNGGASGIMRPVSLWVGTDCAKNLLGCEVEGEGLYEERGGTAE